MGNLNNCRLCKDNLPKNEEKNQIKLRGDNQKDQNNEIRSIQPIDKDSSYSPSKFTFANKDYISSRENSKANSEKNSNFITAEINLLQKK